jgi:hypothetical protein
MEDNTYNIIVLIITILIILFIIGLVLWAAKKIFGFFGLTNHYSPMWKHHGPRPNGLDEYRYFGGRNYPSFSSSSSSDWHRKDRHYKKFRKHHPYRTYSG